MAVSGNSEVAVNVLILVLRSLKVSQVKSLAQAHNESRFQFSSVYIQMVQLFQCALGIWPHRPRVSLGIKFPPPIYVAVAFQVENINPITFYLTDSSENPKANFSGFFHMM